MLMSCVMRSLPVTVLLAALGACAEPDPTYGDPGGFIGQKLPNDKGGGGGSSGGSGSDPFGGAYSPDANKPATTLKAAHTAAASKGAPSGDNVPDCLTCHKTGGVAAGKAFAFGGRVNGNQASVDVVVVDAAGNLGPVKSDADGYFWFESANAVKKGDHVSLRNKSSTAAMTQQLQDGDGGCDGQSCHGGNIGLPGSDLK
jgi:hypothetical protein